MTVYGGHAEKLIFFDNVLLLYFIFMEDYA